MTALDSRLGLPPPPPVTQNGFFRPTGMTRNTRYLDAALAQVRHSGGPVKPEDVERLSRSLLDHINVLGRYESPSRNRFGRDDCGRSGALTIPMTWRRDGH